MNFEQVFSSLPIAGWLAEDEGRLLWQAATSAGGNILEIGSYCGRSAVLLASAMSGTRRRLFCCDPFRENFDGMKTPEPYQIALALLNSLCRSSLAQHVTICWQDEEHLRRDWQQGRLGLLYIDGDHSYEATLGALNRWGPLADSIAMHDYGQCESFEGVKRAADNYGLCPPLQCAGSMAFWSWRLRP